MKIGVYTICKNEAKHVVNWLQAVGEADAICVTDTGSKDETLELLETYDGGTYADVFFYNEPFRFDKARNYALKWAKTKHPEIDIWVSLDMDEYPEPGWRQKFEENVGAWRGWRITIDNGTYTFKNIRAHKANGPWEWQHACHEVLVGKSKLIGDAGFKVIHHQDPMKPRDYLPLLELDAEENKDDARAWHYLGREYMYKGMWEKAIDALDWSEFHEDWLEQRGRTILFESRCYWHNNQLHEAKALAWRSVKVWGSREAWVHLAWLLDLQGDPSAAFAAEQALRIRKHGTYPDEASAWAPETQKWLIRLSEGADDE